MEGVIVAGVLLFAFAAAYAVVRLARAFAERDVAMNYVGQSAPPSPATPEGQVIALSVAIQALELSLIGPPKERTTDTTAAIRSLKSRLTVEQYRLAREADNAR